MRRFQLAAAIAILVFSLVTGRPGLAGELPRRNPTRSDLMRRSSRKPAVFRDAVAKKEIAGAVLLVARHGKVAYLEAVGKQDVEAGVAMSPGSIFRIASMTKPITSTAAMILADQGRLELSDPISKFLTRVQVHEGRHAPEDGGWRQVAGQSWRRIRPRPGLSADHRAPTFLMHTSGLCYRFTDRPHVGRLYAEANICDGLIPSEFSWPKNVRRLAGLPLHHQPGTAWEWPQHRRAGPARGSRLGTAAGSPLSPSGSSGR